MFLIQCMLDLLFSLFQDYVVWMQYVGPLFLVGLVILTEIHLYHVSVTLNFKN